MITIGSFRDINPTKYNEIWVIVRSLKDKSILTRYPNARHVPELSPSPELFQCYLSWKKANDWNIERFEQSYVPMFLQEMVEPLAKDFLNELYYKNKAGKDILLVCFCSTEEKCHRSVVGGLLQGAGVPVVSTQYPYFIDYSNYYSTYRLYREQKNSR